MIVSAPKYPDVIVQLSWRPPGYYLTDLVEKALHCEVGAEAAEQFCSEAATAGDLDQLIAIIHRYVDII